MRRCAVTPDSISISRILTHIQNGNYYEIRPFQMNFLQLALEIEADRVRKLDLYRSIAPSLLYFTLDS